MTTAALMLFLLSMVTFAAAWFLLQAAQRDSEEALRILDRAKIHHDATEILLERITKARRTAADELTRMRYEEGL